MPGTIQVSILELVGHPSLQQSSSMGIKVSMGKQAYDVQEKGDFSFVLASLLDNLSVSIRDSEGNEIAHTGVESRSIVEKGTWDDIFPLQGGGQVHMRLRFILTEEEQKRIRSMRESAARKKHEDLLKRSHSSSDLAVATDSLKTSQQAQDGNMNPTSRQPKKFPGSSTQVPNQVHPGPKKQAFLTSKSTGALDKLPGYQRVRKEIQPRNEEQQNQLDKKPSNAFRTRYQNSALHKQDASPAPSKTRATAKSDIPLKAAKKTVPVSGKPVLSKLEIVPAPKRQEVGDYVVFHQETMCSTTTADIPLKSLKKRVYVSAKPNLPNFEIVPAPTSKEIVTERKETVDYVDSCQEALCSTTTTYIPLKAPKKMITMNNLETLAARISEEIVTEGVDVGDNVNAFQEILVENSAQLAIQSIDQMSNEKNIYQSQPAIGESKEEIILPNKLHSRSAASGQSKFSWKILSQGLPRHIADISVMKKQCSTSFDSSVFEKNWRSKHPKSCENIVKSKASCGNKIYSSGSFRGWIFIEEIIHSCVRSDDRPLINLLEAGCSNCSRDTYQEKLRDTNVVPGKDDKSSVELSPFGFGERPESSDSKHHIRPVRQAVNFAIMVGFGILVFLTRQRK